MRSWWDGAFDGWVPIGLHWLYYLAGGCLSMGLTGLFVWMLFQGESRGLPRVKDLQTIEGVVETRLPGNHDVEFFLANDKRKYAYLSKAGEPALVAKEVVEFRHVSILVDSSQLTNERKAYVVVYGITVNGVPVRTFDQVVEDWRTDNGTAWLLSAFFAFSAATLLGAALDAYRSGKSSKM